MILLDNEDDSSRTRVLLDAIRKLPIHFKREA